jgi:ATP-dependent Lon protease
MKARKRMSKRVESESEEEETPKKGLRRIRKPREEESEEEPTPKKRGFIPRKKVKKIEEESEEEDEDAEDADDADDEEEDEDEEDEDYESEEEEASGRGGLIISFGGEEAEDRMVPKRHNMKKESAEVKKFVELITKPREEDGIDAQIDEFKRLTPDKQTELLTTLDRKATSDSNAQSMMFKILGMKLTPETQNMILAKYNTLQTMDPGAGEYYKQRAWLEKFTSLPLGIYRDIPVKLADGSESCGAFMARAQRCLSEAIYGQDEAKIQILQFIASKIANPDARGLSLLLSGPPGIGKTSLIKNGIAKALGWPFQFISLGGDSDASTYMGHQLVYEGSHAGKIVNSVVAAKSLSMILMFDELDKISTTAKGEEVQNLLVHLTDPVQNGDFEDKYLSGIPIDLSKVLFTFSANDLNKIDRVLMDRMVVIELQGYSAKDKMAIAQTFLLPSALKDVNLDEKVSIGPDVLEHILKEYASEEKGVRELKRCVEAVVQKINMLRIFNTKDLPFHIPEFQLPFVVKKSHVDLFLKKKPTTDPSVMRMYT